MGLVHCVFAISMNRCFKLSVVTFIQFLYVLLMEACIFAMLVCLHRLRTCLYCLKIICELVL